jgi:iodotyrosine deiodinase
MSYDFIPLDFKRLEPEEQRRRAAEFYELMSRRRTVREFSPDTESAGIACGMPLAALHNAGPATLTHTPNPMGFLSEILQRPKNEKPYLLVPVGYPAGGAKVPNITKKPLNEIMRVVE